MKPDEKFLHFEAVQTRRKEQQELRLNPIVTIHWMKCPLKDSITLKTLHRVLHAIV